MKKSVCYSQFLIGYFPTSCFYSFSKTTARGLDFSTVFRASCCAVPRGVDCFRQNRLSKSISSRFARIKSSITATRADNNVRETFSNKKKHVKIYLVFIVIYRLLVNFNELLSLSGSSESSKHDYRFTRSLSISRNE